MLITAFITDKIRELNSKQGVLIISNKILDFKQRKTTHDNF